MMNRLFLRLSAKAGAIFRPVDRSGPTRKFSQFVVEQPRRKGKLYFESENVTAHRVLEERPQYSSTTVALLKPPLADDLSRSGEVWIEFCRLTQDAYEGRSGPLSEDRYSDMCREMASTCHNLSDSCLATVLSCLSFWPMCESPKSSNFHGLWKALDSVCLERRNSWSTRKVLYYVDLWYHIQLARMSDFVYLSIRQLCKKPSKLLPSELVQVLFYLNAIRTGHKGLNMYELEARLEDSLDLLSVEEIGVATLGFFKTQTVIHGASLQEALIRRIIKEVDTIPEQALVSIIKALRMSLVIPVWPMAESLLGVLCSQIGRISLKGCAHIVLLTARTHSVHSQILDLVSQKLLKSIDQARLKDLEKVLYPLTTLNYDPKTSPCIFKAIAAELNRPERQQEFTVHPKCLVAIVHYLALLSIFPHDAIARVLDMNFIRETYGRTNYMIGREILSIETCLEIDSPDYSGPRLPEDVRNYLSKRYSTFLPNREKRLSKHGAFVLDVIDTLEIVLGKECMVCKYVLPNNSRADVVFGLDREGKALPIPDDYRNHPDFTGVLRLPKVDGDWRAIVLCSLNMLVRNRAGAPNGETAAKIRHLRKLGYTPLMVTLDEWSELNGQLQKSEYLKSVVFGQATK